MIEDLKIICKARKRDYINLKEAAKADPEHGPTNGEVHYARGVYFGMLAALKVANNGEPVRI